MTTRLDQFEEKLKRARPPEHSFPRVLYHYTTAGGFEGIVRSRAIRATNFSFMNDPSEIQYGRQMVINLVAARARAFPSPFKDFLTAVIADIRSEPSEIYVASFSTTRDDLSQWRAYGSGSPVRLSLGLHTTAVIAAATAEYPHFVRFSRVLYERHEQIARLNAVLDAAVTFLRQNAIAADDLRALRERLSRHLMRMLPELKDPAYRAESEWRIIILVRPSVDARVEFDTSKGVIRPYLLFPLETRRGQPLAVENVIVLAPVRPDSALKAATMVLRDVGIAGTNPRPSGIPFAD